MNDQTLSRSLARQFIIDKAENNIFSVQFIKKDGSIRDMRCRLGVNKDLKGVGHKFDPKEYDLLCVYDMGLASKGTDINGNELKSPPYRMININTLTEVKINGVKYLVHDDNKQKTRND